MPDRATLAGLAPRFDLLDAECRRLGYLGCFVYVPPSATRPAAARMFAPSIGVPEDVANANSTGTLAAYLLAHHIAEVTVDQGDSSGRPSTVYARAACQDGDLVASVGGVTRV